ncbi:hypothetical protein ACOSQ3_027196 [Xanthoceras sorbifolium]
MKMNFSARHSSKSIARDICHEDEFLHKLNIRPGALHKTCHEDKFLHKPDIRPGVLHDTYVMKINFSISRTFV